VAAAAGALACAAPAQTAPPAAERVEVPAQASYTGKPFAYTKALRERNHRCAVYDVRYPSPVTSPHEANNTVPAELYLPQGEAPARSLPAVVCLHIIHDNFDLERLLCTRLAQRGVAALFFKQPYYGERGGEVGKAMLASGSNIFMGGLEQGLEDARRAVDVAQSLPEVNPERIGITGISMGAVQSASVCGREPRIRKAFLTLGGCDIKSVILTAHETRRMRAFIQGLPQAEQERVWACVERLDPLQSAGALRKLAAAGGLRMICAEQDQVIPPACGRRLAEAAGFADRVTWLKGMDHYTAMAGFPQIMDEVIGFFGADVPAAWRPPAGNGQKSASELLGSFLSGLAAFAGGAPSEGAAHMVGVEAEATVDGKAYRAAFDWVRGAGGRFRLSGDFPEVGRAGLGLGDYPWLVGGGKKVFCGTLEAQPARHPAQLVTPQRLMRYKVGVGALAGVALSPEALQQYYTLSEEPAAGGAREVVVRVSYKKTTGELRLTFGADGAPRAAAWAFEGASGRARFTHWRLNAVAGESLFDAPAGLPRQEVRQEDVMRMLAAAFEFGVEATE
jgi:dienelactone hydrolase